MSDSAAEIFDAAVIGGGPGGSAAAALLAKAGRSVCLLEQSPFPRFHIGESLLPAGNKVLRELDLWDDLEAHGYLRKWGAEFTYGDGSKRVEIDFSKSRIRGEPHAYQVERARFDTLLLNKAEAHGGHVCRETRVAQITEDTDHWLLRTVDKSGAEKPLRARWLLDASGRARILARHLGIARETVALPDRVAVFNHFTGVARRPGKSGNNIIVVRIHKGWFWIIPIDSKRTSVGLVKVIDKEDGPANESLFRAEVARCPYMERLMGGARASQLDFHVEADYSYINRRIAGKNFLMLGDAAGFLDPVFSSGVYLALHSAKLATGLILACDRKGASLSPRQQAAYQREVRKRMLSWLRIIQVFYHEKDFSIFMSPTDKFDIFNAVNAVVAGYPPQSFSLRWRYTLFLLACRLNRHFQLAPPVVLK